LLDFGWVILQITHPNHFDPNLLEFVCTTQTAHFTIQFKKLRTIF